VEVRSKGKKNRAAEKKRLYKEPGHRQIIRDRQRKASFEKEHGVWMCGKKREFQRNLGVKIKTL